MRDIARVIGLADTLTLVDHCGGTALYVPVQFNPEQVLCKIIGPESAVKFIAEYAEERLDLPKCDNAIRWVRNRLICKSDKTQKAKAREWHLTERQIRNIEKANDHGYDERQDSLFD